MQRTTYRGIRKAGRLSWTGLPLAVALGMGVINVGAASAAPTPPAFMTSTVGDAITIAVVKDNPAGGLPNPSCAPVVQEIRLDDQPGYRFAPPTSAEAIAGGGIPAISAASTVVVPHDGIYAVGAVCRDPGGESPAPPLIVTIGGDRKSTRLNSSHHTTSRMPSSA